MNAGGKYLFGRPSEWEIEDDVLYRYDFISDTEAKKIPIISKNEFMMCYESWVKAESEKVCR
jgi:hypothetical protein